MQILTNPGRSVGADTLSWQQQMRTSIRDLKTLQKALDLAPPSATIGDQSNSAGTAADAEASFSVFAPQPFVDRIERGNALDPLLLQLLPTAAENQSPEHFSLDPLAEADAVLTEGVLKKYAGRALFIVTGACAIHCRYCFRRHFPYSENSVDSSKWDQAIDAIAADPQIEEVILSGGDPLTVVNATLKKLFVKLESVTHLKRIRIHTRLPIMIPNRVTNELIEIFSGSSKQQVMVIHSNHANEIDDQVAAALQKLSRAGVTLLNQSVLLAGVNDSAEALIDLSKRLLATGVMPYYLHQLDEVVGAAHFEVPVERGVELISEMRAALPGFAVPRYVKEIPGQPNKTVLA